MEYSAHKRITAHRKTSRHPCKHVYREHAFSLQVDTQKDVYVSVQLENCADWEPDLGTRALHPIFSPCPFSKCQSHRLSTDFMNFQVLHLIEHGSLLFLFPLRDSLSYCFAVLRTGVTWKSLSADGAKQITSEDKKHAHAHIQAKNKEKPKPSTQRKVTFCKGCDA